MAIPLIDNIDHLGPDDAALWIKNRVDYDGRVNVVWRGSKMSFDSLDTKNEIASFLSIYESN